MKNIKIFAPVMATAAAAVMLTGCGLFDTQAQKDFKAIVPEVTRQYDSIKWDEISGASAYDVYRNGEKIDTVTANVYTVGDEFSADSTYYITAHSDSLKRDTQKSNEVVYYKNTGFSEGESLAIKSSSSTTVSNNIRELVFDGYSGKVSLDIADRSADLVISLKNTSITSGLDFTVSDDKSAYTAVIVLDGASSIRGTDGKSYTAADKGANNSEIDGKRGGDGQTALKAGELVIKGDGNLKLTGGNGGNASEGSDSSGLFSTKECGKGASGGNGGNGLTCGTLYLDIGEYNGLDASGGTGGKKSSPGKNGAGISGPIISAAWFNWDIGKDGTAGVATSIGKTVVISGDFGAGGSIKVTSSSTVKVTSDIRRLVFDGYSGEVSLNIADRTSDLTVSLKNSSITSGLDFTSGKSEVAYKVIIELNGNSSITGADGVSYTADDKGEVNSVTDGKRGGDGQAALKASELVIRGNGSLTLKGGNGGNASEGSDSSGYTTAQVCGKGASGGAGGNGLTCASLTLDIGSGNKLTAVGGAGGKKSSPGANGAGGSGPYVSEHWDEWDIGKDGASGDGISAAARNVVSGEIA